VRERYRERAERGGAERGRDREIERERKMLLYTHPHLYIPI
jgi:hypothetical protein